MARYLKWFKTDSEYNTYTADTENFIIPNVSFVESGSTKVRFTPSSDVPPTPPTPQTGTLTCVYVPTGGGSGSGSGSGSGGGSTKLFDNSNNFADSIESMTIDGDEQSSVVNTYDFGDTNEHIVVFSLKDSVTSIGDSAFSSCWGLTSIDMPNGVTSIGSGAFYDCSGLTSIDIPSGVTSIGDSAFYNCSGLISIDIPNSVTSIGDNAFASCSGLISIDIPNSVTSIGSYAFLVCRSLASITVNATTPPTLVDTTAFYDTDNCPIYVPSASVDTYKSATNWSSYANRIEAIS